MPQSVRWLLAIVVVAVVPVLLFRATESAEEPIASTPIASTPADSATVSEPRTATAAVESDVEPLPPVVVPEEPPRETRRLDMNDERLGRHLREAFPDLRGRSGFWLIEVDDEILMVVTDEAADRSRVMMPIREVDLDDEDDRDEFVTCLQANFHKALDAKYALNDGVLWSVFVHPLSTLTFADVDNAIEQVRTLRLTTGSTYSSSGLQFGGGDEEEPREMPDV